MEGEGEFQRPWGPGPQGERGMPIPLEWQDPPPRLVPGNTLLVETAPLGIPTSRQQRRPADSLSNAYADPADPPTFGPGRRQPTAPPALGARDWPAAGPSAPGSWPPGVPDTFRDTRAPRGPLDYSRHPLTAFAPERAPPERAALAPARVRTEPPAPAPEQRAPAPEQRAPAPTSAPSLAPQAPPLIEQMAGMQRSMAEVQTTMLETLAKIRQVAADTGAVMARQVTLEATMNRRFEEFHQRRVEPERPYGASAYQAVSAADRHEARGSQGATGGHLHPAFSPRPAPLHSPQAPGTAYAYAGHQPPAAPLAVAAAPPAFNVAPSAFNAAPSAFGAFSAPAPAATAGLPVSVTIAPLAAEDVTGVTPSATAAASVPVTAALG